MALLTTAAIMGGSMLANKLFSKGFGGRTDFKMINPRGFRDDLVMNEGDVRAQRNQLMTQLGTSAAQQNAQIQSAGAAGRMPAGALLQALGGVQYNTAKGASGINAQLAGEKRKSLADYLGLQMNYDQAKMGHNQANAQQEAGFNQRALGNLAAMLLQSQAGG